MKIISDDIMDRSASGILYQNNKALEEKRVQIVELFTLMTQNNKSMNHLPQPILNPHNCSTNLEYHQQY